MKQPFSDSAAKPFPPRRDYASLSMRDLLDAREAYHVYLSTLENVVATAIGRYLIQKDDWYASHGPNEPAPAGRQKSPLPRTLQNSVVRPWSWPAVLVFVRDWKPREKLGSQEVPRALYLPDGRVVPTCVVLAQPDESLPPPVPGPSQSSTLFGGGYSCLRQHQGASHLGTIGCLVSKEGTYYALTNGHVAGAAGEEVRAFAHGAYRVIGTSAGITHREVTLSEAFPAWPGTRTFLTLDAGLIHVEDVTDWTSQAFGIGEIGDPFDATECTVSLDLIGCPVRAFGGTSGVVEGEVRALFFRYESLGGIDRATDVLIGPRVETALDAAAPAEAASAGVPAPPFTRPGDSGTLWFYDPPSQGEKGGDGVAARHEAPDRGQRARRLRPIAMQWGGQRFRTLDGGSSAFALASFISTIARELRVEIVRDWSTGHDEYWGKIGHFSIGWKACDRVDGTLGQLMKLNQRRIGFNDATLGQGAGFKMGKGGYVPLADVPDYVWIGSSKRPFEPIQHFADVDIRDINGGPALLARGIADPATVSAKVWKAYFDGFAAAGVGPDEGTLPLRVWQIWDAMVEYLKNGDVARFVAAAGVLAHYVGDASQPLHCSFMHHGIPPMVKHDGRDYPVKHGSDAFKTFQKTPEYKIHGIYEEGMLEVDALSALVGVNQALKSHSSKPGVITRGHGAAVETLKLMHATQTRLKPASIIKADDPSLSEKDRARALWNNARVRRATVASLADSVRLLAALWTAAWRQGNGKSLPEGKIREFQESEMSDIYRGDAKFIPSLSLAQMAASGNFEP